MTDNTTLLPLVQKFFENDLSVAAGVLESMPEEEAAGALKSLPIPLAVQVVKVLQVSYAAALLKDADAETVLHAIYAASRGEAITRNRSGTAGRGA